MISRESALNIKNCLRTGNPVEFEEIIKCKNEIHEYHMTEVIPEEECSMKH